MPRRIYPITVKRTTVSGAASPTSKYNESLRLVDAYRHGSTRAESLRVVDAYRHGSTRAESLRLVDAYSVTATATRNDPLRLVDAWRYTLTDLVVGRSGSPNSDQMSDGWTDRASTGTNHGNESLLVKGATTAPGNDQRRGLLQLDLTRLTGHAAGAAGASLAYIASVTGIVATTLNVGFAVQATSWFTESSLNWANMPTPVITNLANQTIATGAAATYTTTFTQAQLTTMLGKWVLVQFDSPNAAVPPTITVLSRDDATASNRPKFTAAFTS